MEAVIPKKCVLGISNKNAIATVYGIFVSIIKMLDIDAYLFEVIAAAQYPNIKGMKFSTEIKGVKFSTEIKGAFIFNRNKNTIKEGAKNSNLRFFNASISGSDK